MFRLTFLGTSSGVPTPQRHVSGLAVEFLRDTKVKSNPWILVDCGEGTQYQLLRTDLKLKHLKAICITHLHGDHCYGLAGLLASMAMAGRSEPLAIVAPKALMKLLDTYSLVTELYFDYPIDFIDIETHLTTGVLLSFGQNTQVHIDITPLSHRMPSYAFGFDYGWQYEKANHAQLLADDIPKTQWRTWIKNHAKYRRIVAHHERLVVAGDNDTPDLLAHTIKGAKALVHECTYTQAVLDKILARGAFNPQHTSAQKIAQFAHQVNLPMLILTHFSARYALFDNPTHLTPNMGHIRTEVSQFYSGACILAHDLMQVVIE